MDQLGDILKINAIRTPERIAVKYLGGEGRSYAAIDDRSSRLARALLAQGLRQGDRVAAWLQDSIEYVELYFAAAKAGLIMVPINERFLAREAIYQIQRTEASCLFVSEGVLTAYHEARGAIELLLVVGVNGAAATIEGARDIEDLIAGASDAPLPAVDENIPFSICFTSGTTGFPKGAVLTHRSLHNVARTQAVALRLALGSINLQLASMSFPATFGSHILSHVYVGGTTVLVGRWGGDAEALMKVVEQEAINHLYLPTPLIRSFANLCKTAPGRWKSLVSVLHAGSRADPSDLELLAEAVGDKYLEGWGMSELSGGITSAISARDLHNRGDAMDFFASVGRPVPDSAVRLVDEDSNPAPHDGVTIGELVIKSSSLMVGYWRDDAATAKAIVDGWYYSGDLGRIDPAGYIYIVDRRTDLIVSGGMNIYPAELEIVINAIPGVAVSAVVAGPHPRWGQTPVAVVEREPQSAVTAEEIMRVTARELASYKKLSRVVFVDELPRHPTSRKLLRNEMRAMVAEQTSESQA